MRDSIDRRRKPSLRSYLVCCIDIRTCCALVLPTCYYVSGFSGSEEQMLRRRMSMFLMAILLAPAAGFAQSVAVAQLSGTVLDESGGALPGVEVVITQTDTGMTRFVISGANGEYTFNNLPVGPYKLTSKLSGFSVFEQTGIVLAVGDTRSVNINMKIGGLTETVTVQSDANLVETRSVNVGTVVPQEQIVSLPLNGRSVLQLIVL